MRRTFAPIKGGKLPNKRPSPEDEAPDDGSEEEPEFIGTLDELQYLLPNYRRIVEREYE